MKQTKLFLFTCILTVSALVAIVYSSSCKKDKCKGVNCQNGGTCSGGNCSCPSGYSGTHCENSTIDFFNNTYTVVSINVGGTATTIPIGGTISFIGTAGSSVNVSTSTYETTSSGGQIGESVSTTFTSSFPINGYAKTEEIDIPSDYFYLLIKNNSIEYINSLYVNYGSGAEFHLNPNIPNDGLTYTMGYYEAYSNTYVYALNTTSGDSWDWPSPYTGTGPGIYIPNTINASVTLTAY